MPPLLQKLTFVEALWCLEQVKTNTLSKPGPSSSVYDSTRGLGGVKVVSALHKQEPVCRSSALDGAPN